MTWACCGSGWDYSAVSSAAMAANVEMAAAPILLAPLRPAVLRRKRSFGSHSEAGCAYVGRLLSVVQTLKRQGRSVLGYLQTAIEAHRHGSPTPKLFPTT